MAECLECRGSFRGRQYGSRFCSTPCRQAFNNRRAQRGATLYDVMMIEHMSGASLAPGASASDLLAHWAREDAGRVTHKNRFDVKHDVAEMLRAKENPDREGRG